MFRSFCYVLLYFSFVLQFSSIKGSARAVGSAKGIWSPERSHCRTLGSAAACPAAKAMPAEVQKAGDGATLKPVETALLGRFLRLWLRIYRFSWAFQRFFRKISAGQLPKNCPKSRWKRLKKPPEASPEKTEIAEKNRHFNERLDWPAMRSSSEWSIRHSRCSWVCHRTKCWHERSLDAGVSLRMRISLKRRSKIIVGSSRSRSSWASTRRSLGAALRHFFLGKYRKILGKYKKILENPCNVLSFHRFLLYFPRIFLYFLRKTCFKAATRSRGESRCSRQLAPSRRPKSWRVA